MPRAYPNSVTVCEQFHVGYGLKKPQGEQTYTVYFRDADGRRLKRDTNQTSSARATQAAHVIIAEAYGNRTSTTVTWNEAMAKLREKAIADGIRSTTIAYYEKLARLIRTKYEATSGPANITPAMAETWKKVFTTTRTRRGELPSPHSVFSLVRGFRSLWSWFMDELGICDANPWQDVHPPKTDKVEVKLIEEATLMRLLSWIDKRYSGWELPRLFIETKAVTGCRLMDLCSIESSQLRDGRLQFRPDQTKGRKGRSVPLPPDLFAKLDAFKGPRYLWESYPAGLIDAVKKMGCPVHGIKSDFRPSRLYHWIETLFIEFGKKNPDEPAIHSHQLRKRAFTAAWKNNIDPRKAAIAYGCNVDTVMKHYVQLDEQAVTDEVTRQLAATLAVKSADPESSASNGVPTRNNGGANGDLSTPKQAEA